MILESGIELVGQMMIGLPASTLEKELETAEFIIKAGAQGARIYPTVVFYETELCEMARNGDYEPLSLDEAVSRGADVLEVFINEGVPVIRIGLCASDNLVSEKTYFSGPNHPAIGELIESEIYYRKICNEIDRIAAPLAGELSLCVARGALSKAVGQRKKNVCRLKERYGVADVKIKECADVFGYGIKILT